MATKPPISPACLNDVPAIPAPDSTLIDSKRLKTLRMRMGLTQQVLAERTGVSQQTICRLERSSIPAETRTLGALARGLGVSVGTLLGDEPGDPTGFSGAPATTEALKKFLGQLALQPNALGVLEQLTRQWAARPAIRPVLESSAAREEEILGRWVSLMVAYETADWVVMLKHAKRITLLGEELDRPHLIAIGHAYVAKALRNMGSRDDLERASAELDKIPPGVQSAIVSRLRGKMLLHKKKYRDALTSLEEALKLSGEKAGRKDLLYAVERAKLLRNFARCYTEMAWEAVGENGTLPIKRLPVEQQRFAKDAKEYLVKTRKAVRELKKHSPRTHQVEQMLLLIAEARLAQKQGDYPGAIKKSLQAIEVARSAEARFGEMKMRIFLVECYYQIGNHQKAYELCMGLLAAWHKLPQHMRTSYKHWAGPHEDELKKWNSEKGSKLKAPDAFRAAGGDKPTARQRLAVHLKAIEDSL